jgi:hypothetical protein
MTHYAHGVCSHLTEREKEKGMGLALNTQETVENLAGTRAKAQINRGTRYQDVESSRERTRSEGTEGRNNRGRHTSRRAAPVSCGEELTTCHPRMTVALAQDAHGIVLRTMCGAM